MVATLNRLEALHIRGTPPNLSTVMRLNQPVSIAVPVVLDLPKKVAKATEVPPLSVVITPLKDACDAGISHLHLQVPRTTPPGTYHGMVKMAHQDQPIVIEIKPFTRVRILPKRTIIQSHPGKRVALSLTLINIGNVVYEVPKAAGFGLYNKRGMDLAIANTFQAVLDKNERRIDRFMEELREGYSGIIRLKIIKGAGTLDPGDARDLDIVFDVPINAIPGQSYWGIWSINDYNYKIDIDIIPENVKSSNRTGKK